MKLKYNFIPKDKPKGTVIHFGTYGIILVILSLMVHGGVWFAIGFWLLETIYCTYKTNKNR